MSLSFAHSTVVWPADRIRRALPLLAVVGVIAVNSAAVLLPINSISTAELSDLNPTGFTPAGYVFAIWSLIFAGLLAFALSQIAGSEARRRRGDKIGGLVVANAIANMSWIFAWHYRLVPLSFLIMVVILASLVAINVRLRRHPAANWREWITADGPFSLYLGWIAAATALNLATVFFDRGQYPGGLTGDQWGLVSMAACVAIFAWVGAVTRDVVFCSVFVWAAIGIAANPDRVGEPVRLVAICGAVVLAFLVTWIVVIKAAARLRLADPGGSQ